MRIPRTLALPATMVLIAACNATVPMQAAPTQAAPTQATAPDSAHDATHDPTPGPAAVTGPPRGASGKISPAMVGKVSPVPAFVGLGERFTIEIRSVGEHTAGGMRHRVRLVRAGDATDGVLFYRGTPGAADGAPIVLDGSVDTAGGPKALRVEIAAGPCTDAAGTPHPQRVKIALQGAAGLHGCGDLAVY